MAESNKDNKDNILSNLSEMLTSSKLTSDGSVSFIGGQNSSLLPHQIDDTSYAKGINVSVKRGALGPRAGYIQQKLTFLNDASYFDPRGVHTTYKKIFESGKFQGACNYYTEAGERIIAVVSGFIYCIYPKKKTVQHIPIDDEQSIYTEVEDRLEPYSQRLNQYHKRVNFAQAGTYLVIFDYPDRPVILDSFHAFRSPVGQTDTLGYPVYYVPATVMGCYNQNRLFVCSATNEFTAGDPTGSAVAPKAPITFNELYQKAGEYIGQTFSLGSTNKNNPITAMGFLQVTDSSTGTGPLFVATKDAIYTYDTNQSRSQWTGGNTAFGKLALYSAGIAGPKAVANINSDLIFVDGTGRVRAFNASKQYESTWENAPIDIEVFNWIDSPIDKSLSVVATSHNKVFITVQPNITTAIDLYGNYTNDYAFKGLIVLELDHLSGLRQDGGIACWAGIWTGVNTMDMVTCEDELYIFAKDPAYTNSFYHVDFNETQDFYNNTYKNIKSRIYTKQYAPTSTVQDKEERCLIVGLQDLEGHVKVEIRRANDSSNFRSWRVFETNALTCSMTEPKNLMPHSYRELNFGSPEETECNPVTGELESVYRKCQLMLDISAENWTLESIYLLADKKTTDYSDTICDLEDSVEATRECNYDSDLNLYHTADYVEE